MDAVSPNKTTEALLTVFCPTFSCVTVGLVAQGVGVFTPQSGFFQLGVNAVIVGVLVLIARWWAPRRFLAVGVLIVAAMTAATVRSGPRIALHTALLMVMWVTVVFLNVKVLGHRQWVRALGVHVVWSFVFALGLFGAGGVLVLSFRPSDAVPHLVFYARLSVLTGIGLGLGFKIQEWLSVRPGRGP